jgi:tRNA(Leu) C34 or U34 (ribose-2'-O)-methylase TrmL
VTPPSGSSKADRGFCGIGVFHPKTSINVGTLWRSAHVLGADFIFTVGRRYERQSSDTTKAWKHLPLFNFESMDDLHEHLPYGCPLVGVELDPRAVPLSGFKHPERACYVLGAEDHGLSLDALERCHAVIQLPGTYCLNVAVAGSIVLHHRIENVGGGALLPMRRGADAPEGSSLRVRHDLAGQAVHVGGDRAGMGAA